MVLGDARIELGRELAAGQSHDFDLIAVDAFSSDSIPMHLLTAECADIYRRRLAPGGVLALHISNRVLNLDPVARGMARYLGWNAVQIISKDDAATGESASHWVLMSPNAGLLERAGLLQRSSGMERSRADHLDRRFREPVACIDFLDRLVFGVADRIQFALGALGFARDAQRPAMEDELQGEIEPFLRGMIFIKSCSIFTGLVFLVRSSRAALRWTCVSTTTPSCTW